MFVWLSVGILLSFAFEYRSFFPDAFVCCVIQVVVRPACDWYQCPCLRDEAVYLFLYGDDELSTVGGLEGVCCLYFLCVAGVVFGVKQNIDAYERMMSVSVSVWSLSSVGKMAGGGFRGS